MEQQYKAGMTAAIAAGLALVGAQAHAEFYAGGSVGSANLESSDSYNGTSLDFESDDTAFKVFGGYLFNDYLGVEIAYHDFGDQADSMVFDGGETGTADDLRAAIDAELTGFSAQGVAQYPLGPVDVFAKLGFVMYDLEADLKLNRVANGALIASDNLDDDGNELMWGVGARYNVGQFGVRAEYEVIEADDIDDAFVYSIGVEYRFPQ